MSVTVRQWASLAILIAAVMVLSGEAVGMVPQSSPGPASTVSARTPFNYSKVASQIAAGSLPAFPDNLTHFIYIVRENHVFDDYLGDCATTINASCNGGANSPGANSWSDTPYLHQWGKAYSIFDNMYSSVDPYSAQAHAYLFSANSWGGSDSGSGCSNWAVEGTGSSTQWGNYNSSAVKSGSCGYSPDSGSQSYDATGGSIFDRFLGPNVAQSKTTIPFASFGDIIWELSSPGCAVASTSGIPGSLPENSVAVEHVTGCSNGWWQNSSSGSPDMPPTVNTATGIPQMVWECQYACAGAPSPFLDQYVAYSFISYVKDYGLPTYSFLELFDDHPGSNCGSSHTQATCIQWNDASMNLIVEDIMNSTSVYKDNTVIAISEDDTQNGQNNPDHINSGRRFPFVMVASHNVMKGTKGLVIHQTFNTSNVLAVMERVEMNVNPNVFITGGISPNSNAFPMVQNDYLAEGNPLEPLWKCGQTGVPCNTGTTVSGPTITSFTSSQTSFTLGGTTYLNATVTGGTTPYTYAYTGLPTGCASANSPSLVCTPTATGTFTVTLTVTDAASLTATGTVSFTVNPSGVGLSIKSFTAGPATIAPGGTTYFNVSATGGSPPYTYAYTGLPAGCTSSNTSSLLCTPTATTGTFTVTVTVTDMKSATATATATLTISAAAPVLTSVSLTPKTLVLGAGGTTTFYAQALDQNGNPYTTNINYQWTLSSGTVGTMSPTSGTGNTSVLTASTTAGATATLTVSATSGPALVSSQASVSIFGASATESTTSGAAPLTVTFTATASGGVAPYGYLWNFGDGNTSASQGPSHTYTTGGSFTPSVTVTDSQGHSTTYSLSAIAVSGGTSPLSVSATGTPLTGAAPLPVQFTGSVSGGKSPYTYAWNFGDGGTSTSQSPAYTYSKAGSYSAVFSVTDSTRATKSFTLAVTAQASVAGKVNVALVASPMVGYEPLTVSFAAAASGGTDVFSSYAWSFGDNSAGSGSQTTHAYQAVGTFPVEVTVTDSSGLQGHAFTNITVNAAPPPNNNNTPAGAQTPWLEYAAIGVAVVLAIALVAVLARRKKGQEPPPYEYGGYPPMNQGLESPPYQAPPPGMTGAQPYSDGETYRAGG